MNTPPVDPDREALLSIRALQDGGVTYEVTALTGLWLSSAQCYVPIV